jgi:hypothetical protein
MEYYLLGQKPEIRATTFTMDMEEKKWKTIHNG